MADGENMATRAIRYDKIELNSNREVRDALSWLNYNHNDTVISQPLREACEYEITHAGDSAQDFQQTINNMRTQRHYAHNYYEVIGQVYGHLIPHLIHIEMQNHGFHSIMRDSMTEMRDYAKANATRHPHYADQTHFDGHSDQTYMDMFFALNGEMNKIASSVNAKYFPPKIYNNGGYGTGGIVKANLNYNIVSPETTDEQIENWVNIQTGNWGHIWRQNTYYFLRGGHGQNNIHQYPQIPADVMEGFMEHLMENHPILALMIAKNNQIFIDNPQAQSIGHSWTSKNRSDDCWFKEAYDQVDKKNTTVFAPPVNLFGQHIPSLTDMLDVFDTMKADLLQFLDDIQPVLKSKKDAQQALQDKTDESAEKAMAMVIQKLLDDPATLEVGTAIVGHIAGIATLPIDMSGFAGGVLPYTYHDFERKEDIQTHLYPHHLQGVIPLTAFTLTDEVQGKLYEAYRKQLDSYRANHANRCAQLARQIAQATTRHDAEVATLTEAFAEYQAQV